MARRRRAEKRRVDPDPKYQSLMLARFINKTMKNGKKSTAQRIVYDALDIIENTEKKGGMDVFEQAIRNTSPLLEVKPRRVGGATYQVPREVRSDRASLWPCDGSLPLPGPRQVGPWPTSWPRN